MHRKVAAAFIVSLALGVASCGGAEPLTRAQLVRRVEVACREGQRQSQKQLRTVRGSSDRSREQFIAAIVGGQRTVIARIRDLDVSDEAKSDFDAFKQAVQQRLDLFARIQSVGGANLQRAIDAVQGESAKLTQRVQSAARGFGVDTCI